MMKLIGWCAFLLILAGILTGVLKADQVWEFLSTTVTQIIKAASTLIKV